MTSDKMLPVSPFQPDTEKFVCPHGHGKLEPIEDGRLALLTPPPFAVESESVPAGLLGTPRSRFVAVSAYFPVTGYVCPVCSLVQLYADER